MTYRTGETDTPFPHGRLPLHKPATAMRVMGELEDILRAVTVWAQVYGLTYTLELAHPFDNKKRYWITAMHSISNLRDARVSILLAVVYPTGFYAVCYQSLMSVWGAVDFKGEEFCS